MSKDTIELALFLVTWTVKGSTVNAYGFKEKEDMPELIWIPAQFVHDISENYKRNTFVEIEVEEWIAKEKGLI